MDEQSEPNQNEQMADELSIGEPSFVSFPFSELSHSENSDILAAGRIRHFAQAVLSTEAWFRIADELIAAMDLLEPHIEGFWEDVRSLVLAVDMTSAMSSSKHQTSAVPSKHVLINQHMMLAASQLKTYARGILRVNQVTKNGKV